MRKRRPASSHCCSIAAKFKIVATARSRPVFQRTMIAIALVVALAACDDGTGRLATSPISSSTSKLTFVVQPSTVKVGATITPAVQVAIQNAAGVTVGSATGSVTLSIASGPSGGILSGTLTRNAVNGIATFNDLSISLNGGYTLQANSGNLAIGTSAAFSVNP